MTCPSLPPGMKLAAEAAEKRKDDALERLIHRADETSQRVRNMIPDSFFPHVVEPTLQWMAANAGIGIPVNNASRVLVMAIAGQESRWKDRLQHGGPARGFWQFEQGGGVAGVLNHPASSRQARVVCGTEDIPSDIATVYEAIAWHDRLACSFARLLLWTDAAPIPAVGDKAGAWQYYLRNWRPGKPHPETWGDLYDQSLSAVGA